MPQLICKWMPIKDKMIGCFSSNCHFNNNKLLFCGFLDDL